MIRYKRTEWYGLMYLARIAGSTLPRCLPAVLYAIVTAVFFSSGVVDRAGWPIRDFFGHPYAMQLLGLVFGYLSISRLQMSYDRYWEGITYIKMMHSNWTTGCLQLLAFDRVAHSDRVPKPEEPETGEQRADSRPQRPRGAEETANSHSADPFVLHLTRLFKQLSAMCIVELHADDGVLGTWVPAAPAVAPYERGSFRSFKRHSDGSCGEATSSGDSFVKLPGMVMRAPADAPPSASSRSPSPGGATGGSDSSVHSQHQFRSFNDMFDHVFGQGDAAGSNSRFSSAENRELAARRQRQREGMKRLMREDTDGAEEFYMASPSAPTACMSRILRTLSTRQLAGGMSAPSPMVARALQDLSKGFEAYNSATKMKEVPVPFAYVQVNALLLLVFNLITPIAIACFSSPNDGLEADADNPLTLLSYNRTMHCSVAALLSAVVVAGFTAMWLVANELEDPFGSDANDIDVLSYHERFCEALDFTKRRGRSKQRVQQPPSQEEQRPVPPQQTTPTITSSESTPELGA